MSKNKNFRFNIFVTLSMICFFFSLCPAITEADEQPLIFPLPQQIEVTEDYFTLDENTIVLVPQHPTKNDLALARFLVREVSDQYNVAIKIEHASNLPQSGNAIMMGTIENPLVREYCNNHKIKVTANNPGREGYVLQVEKNTIVIAGWDDAGSFYGLQSLRQLVKEKDGLAIPCVSVRDWPELPFRGIRLYIPGTENISFFKRFLRDFMALYKFNKVVVEVNCMRLDRHPEVNAGWLEFSKYMHYTRSSELSGAIGKIRNSGHQDAGDGLIIEKEDVRDIVRAANENFIEVIPEIPSLTHCYYLLTRHPELAEDKDAIWPDTYCPSNPKSYELLFDVFDEYIEVIDPKMIHIGHDEWWGAPLGVCSNCKDKDYSDLFAGDVVRIYDYLAKKGITIAMWGDHLLESVRGAGPKDRTSADGVKYQTPGGLRPSVVEEKIPKDILIFNWFWRDQKKDMELQKFGFKQLYGNFKPNIMNWDSRIKEVDVVGGAPSAWAATTEFNFGKDVILDYLGCANLLWSNHTLDQAKLGGIVRNMTSTVRRYLYGKRTPSEDGDPVEPIEIASHMNMPPDTKMLELNIHTLKSGEVESNKMRFKLQDANQNSGNGVVAVGVQGEGDILLPAAIEEITIDEDVSSLLFLHACARPSGNQKSYFDIFNTFDSADLLGWYEIIYEDGFIESIPIQYGVNILEWNPGGEKSFDKNVGNTGAPQTAYCYAADAVQCSSNEQDNPIYFYAFEWSNKRMGKKIKEVNLRGSVNYQALQPEYSQVVTKLIESNAIMLLGLSKVKKREVVFNN